MTCSSVSIVGFEEVNVCWGNLNIAKNLLNTTYSI